MRGISIFLCVLLCFVFAGCESEAEQTPDISEYLERFAAMDYVGMYAQTSVAVDIDEEGFIKKYDDIFSGLGITQVVIDNVSPPSEDGVFTFTATYKTEEYGDYTNAFSAKAGFVDDGWKVLWDYSLIFPEMETGYSVRVDTLHADRGEIFAADGSLMARNAYADTLYMDTTQITDIASVKRAVQPLTGLSDSQIETIYYESLENGIKNILGGVHFGDELTQSEIDAVLAVPGLGIYDRLYMDAEQVKDIDAVVSTAGSLTRLDDLEIEERYEQALKKGTKIVVLGEYFAGELTKERIEKVRAVPGLGVNNGLYMELSELTDLAAVISVTVPLTELSESEIREKFEKALEKGSKIVALGEFFDGELTQAEVDSVLSVPGLGIDDEMYTPIRDYPMKELAAHLVGYTGYYSEDSLPEGYTISDKAGLSGLEAAYETQLKGSDGKIVYIEDNWGNNVRTLYHVPCEQGQDLRLTIKPTLQKKAYDALDTQLEGDETGAVIVMDASTGYVEAMVSYPSFDNNAFTFGLSEEMWTHYNASESNRPLFSRTTQGLYPPGSVIKPFTASAALSGGVITPDTEFDGVIEDDQWRPDEQGWHWEPITRVDNSGSPLKLYNGLIYSDNIYFAFAAMRLGADAFMQYMRSIGMEEAVPFNLPVKEAGLIKEEMTRRLLADMGYGQGQLVVTPLQMASMYTAFANGSGDMLQPILVEKLCQTDGINYNTVEQTGKTVWIDGAISSSNLDILRPILHGVVEEGTGKSARVSGVKVAGKTGTAEIGNDKSREISWFAGYWEDGYYPRLVVVMVDTAAEEGAVKFEIAKALLAP